MILAIDIGGTSAKMGLLRESGEILSRREVSVSFDGYRTPILDTVIRAAGEDAAELARTVLAEPARIGAFRAVYPVSTRLGAAGLPGPVYEAELVNTADPAQRRIILIAVDENAYVAAIRAIYSAFTTK